MPDRHTPERIADEQGGQERPKCVREVWGVCPRLRKERNVPEANTNQTPKQDDGSGAKNHEDYRGDYDVQGQCIVAQITALC